MKIRTRLTPNEAKSLGLPVKKNEQGRNTARYYLTPEQREKIFAERGGRLVTVRKVVKGEEVILEEKKLRSPIEPVPDGFKITKISTNRNTGHQWITMQPDTHPEIEITEDDIKRIVSELVKEKPTDTPPQKDNEPPTPTFDRLVIADTHIGMSANDDDTSPFDINWSKDHIEAVRNRIAASVLLKQKSEVLYFDDLGDFVDNWGGYTVRRDHKMPTEFPTHEIFDLAVKFKVDLVRSLLKGYEMIVMHNVCNDNHGGDFAYIVNSTVKMVLEQMYPNRVFVHNIRQFFGHYVVGNRAFILSHGKDGRFMKNGMPLRPRQSDVERINAYIVANNLAGNEVEFSKGDSHQMLFDYSGRGFSYCNYPPLSPSSEWEQLNFAPAKPGFMFTVYGTYDRDVSQHFVSV